MKSSITNNFIIKANIVHNDKYNYDKTIYMTSAEKIIITCYKHGDFSQRAGHHLSGRGCKKCATDKRSSDLINFIINSNKIHDNKYNYSESKYINSKIKLKIICGKHGIFEQTPNDHLSGYGCKKCGRDVCASKIKSSSEEFIQKSNEIHINKYNYSKVDYLKSSERVIIICKVHGDFQQTPSDHLQGKGCRKCTGVISKIEIEWLDYLNIKNEYRHKSININGKLFKVDALDLNTNTIYEFYGDYWHGNPKRYNQENINSNNKKTFKELYNKTLEKEKTLKEAGYNVISIWENDWNKIKKDL